MRHIKHKYVASGAMLAAALLLIMALAPAVSAEVPISEPTVNDTPVSSERLVLISEPTVNYTPVYDTNKKDISGPSKEEQKRLFDIIQQSGNLTDKEKKDLIKQLEDIWSGKSELTQEEQKQVLLKAGEIISQSQVGVMWWAQEHRDIAWYAGFEAYWEPWGPPKEHLQTLREHADDPDDFGFDLSSPHAWNVDTNEGDAPGKVRNYANTARYYIKNQGNLLEGYKNLAYSMHYMADVANPYHTHSTGNCPGWYCEWHQLYEGFIDSNWNTGHNFNRTVRQDWYYYQITDPYAATINLANATHQYYNYIDARVSFLNNEWRNDPTLVSYTNESLKYAKRYDVGLIYYVNN